MSANEDPRAWMCYRKKGMPEEYARRLCARVPGLRSYQCPICCEWHVTNDFDEEGNRKDGAGQGGDAE